MGSRVVGIKVISDAVVHEQYAAATSARGRATRDDGHRAPQHRGDGCLAAATAADGYTERLLYQVDLKCAAWVLGPDR